ncbi:MAG: ABC transporter substrate-binding protein, partial [Chloroflexi bacterium]|nr:ABC transporter substrate-binding protein [Chloroflexota bacterium]
MFRLEGSQLAPGVIEKWELAPDGLSWLYNVRKGIKFHNGDDLTADDVKFTIDEYTSAKALQSQTRGAVDRVDKVDSYAVRVFTKGKQPFLPSLASWFSPGQGVVLPKKYVEQSGVDGFDRRPVG